MTWDSPTSIDWSGGLGSLFVYLNTVTHSWLSNGILIGIYMIFLAGYYKAQDDFMGALAVAGAITFVMGLLFFLYDFVSWITLSFVIGVLIVGGVALFFRDSF